MLNRTQTVLIYLYTFILFLSNLILVQYFVFVLQETISMLIVNVYILYFV